MTALERAARAVWDSVCLTNDDKSGGYVGTMRDKPFYVDGFVDPAGIARAVLMAVMEPDEAVFDRANEALFDAGEPVAHKVVHLAMIDAILKESE